VLRARSKGKGGGGRASRPQGGRGYSHFLTPSIWRGRREGERRKNLRTIPTVLEERVKGGWAFIKDYNVIHSIKHGGEKKKKGGGELQNNKPINLTFLGMKNGGKGRGGEVSALRRVI